MPLKTEHRLTNNLALPYLSNSSVTSTDPQWIGGSLNLMGTLRQWTERRPGFGATIEQAATAFTNCVRIFPWRRWGGDFFVMFCDISGGFSKVYKLDLTTDTSAVLIWTSTIAEPFDFVISSNVVYFGNGKDMKKYDGTTLTNWGILSPSVAPTFALVAGTQNTYTGWNYVYTYYNSTSGHESSPSPLSLSTGLITNQNVSVGVVASTDPQVTNIRIYRTTDGGATNPPQMAEISNSPFPNTTGSYVDSTPDISLSIRTAPQFFLNDPPPPQKGFVAYGGRLWGFLNNMTYYSGAEEIANGVQEECWPSGLAGNFYPWPNEVMGHASLLDGIAVFVAETVYKVEGDTLDTFRRYILLRRRGTRSRTTIASIGSSVAWLDTSRTIWVSDMGEIGIPIRPDIAAIDPTQAYMAIHIAGLFHWVILLDGAQGILYVYDLDLNQWQVPWDIGTTASALMSGETSVGNIDLMVARNNTKALKLTQNIYLDDGNPYVAQGTSNMYRLTPDDNPAIKGVHDWTEIKTDTVIPTITQCTDDDPGFGVYVSPTTVQPSPDITQGTQLLTTRFNFNTPTAQMLSTRFVWPATNANFHLYNTDEAYHAV